MEGRRQSPGVERERRARRRRSEGRAEIIFFFVVFVAVPLAIALYGLWLAR